MLRVFFCTSGRKIILLLSGYDKARDPGKTRQDREIARARKLLTAHEEAERRRRR
jgi:putative component of toxin-antitoxin plasmid stabilization module